MSDVSQGPGWWQASDGKWYPPEQAPGAAPTIPPPSGPPSGFAPPTGPPAGYGPPSGPPQAYGPPAGPPGGYGPPVGSGSPVVYGTPAGAHGQLAEWPARAASYAIDFFILGIIAAIVRQISTPLGLILQLAAFAFGIYNAYLNGATGQSVGKRIVGTKVVGEQTGQPIGGGAGIIRYLAHFIDAIICGIGFLFPLWDAKKQTIADKIMKTVVITGIPKQDIGTALKGS